MKNILTLEYFACFMLGIAGCIYQPISLSWYMWLLLFFLPDVSMLGYFINNIWGAICYNLFHHFGMAIAAFLLGLYFHIPILQLAGCLLFSHSAFDRMMGYGLKHYTSFHDTHLGFIGKTKAANH
jgi:Domain of unknown function (DUF4260)